MINIIERQFDRLSNGFDRLTIKKIKEKASSLLKRFGVYFKRLLFPLYLFPIKFVTYTIYYLVIFLFKLILALIGLIIDCLTFPFKSLKNFLKSIFIALIGVYLVFSFMVIGDYIIRQYGWLGKFFCAFDYNEKELKKSVVRIVGGYSEGSGFFITDDRILTNFHVVADEPSPKIIFPNGYFTTPVKIIGDRNADLAVLYTKEPFPYMVMPLPEETSLSDNETLIAVGYPLGTDLAGQATMLKGNFVDIRKTKRLPVGYIQTSISLVEGMSGGPLTDQCGKVVGVNTLGLAGLSLFISADEAKKLIPNFTDREITKIQVDPSLSPEEAVKAFYTYLKARRMRDGFNLLSREYLQKTNFEEWTNRFTDILDVDVIKSERFGNTKDTAFVKFSTKNWVDGEAEMHFYEGTWKTVKEEGAYKMLKSKILEVENPGMDWFYE